MKSHLEEYLKERIGYADKSRFYAKRSPRDVIEEMLSLGLIQSRKQAYATLKKWGGKGLYEFGTYFDMGWMLIK